MTVITVLRSVLPVLFIALFVTGCATGSSPVNFYTLNALEASASSTPGIARHLKIGLGPVDIPEMLDRPQIITRAGAHRLEFAEFDRWAGSLQNGISRVLAENLSVLLNTEDVVAYPWGGDVRVDYQVVVEVIGFDAVLNEQARLNVRWKLRQGEQGEVLKGGRSLFTQRIEGQGYETVVAALNRTLDRFSREITEAIRTLERSSNTR